MKLFGWSFSITNAVFYLKACPDSLTTKWMLPRAAGLKIFRAKTRSLIMMSLPDIVIVGGGTIFEGCMLLYTCKNARGFKTNIWYNNGHIVLVLMFG